MAAAAYPRPQLRRPEWQCLDGEWAFCFDDDLRYHAAPLARHGGLRPRAHTVGRTAGVRGAIRVTLPYM